MEENLKQQFVAHTKGMTNTPSDMSCGDDELARCDGMVLKDGELVPIQKPKLMSDIKPTGQLRYIHTWNNVARYIFSTSDTTLRYITIGDTGDSFTPSDDITRILIGYNNKSNCLTAKTYQDVEVDEYIQISVALTVKRTNSSYFNVGMYGDIYAKTTSDLSLLPDDIQGIVIRKQIAYKRLPIFYSILEKDDDGNRTVTVKIPDGAKEGCELYIYLAAGGYTTHEIESGKTSETFTWYGSNGDIDYITATPEYNVVSSDNLEDGDTFDSIVNLDLYRTVSFVMFFPTIKKADGTTGYYSLCYIANSKDARGESFSATESLLARLAAQKETTVDVLPMLADLYTSLGGNNGYYNKYYLLREMSGQRYGETDNSSYYIFLVAGQDPERYIKLFRETFDTETDCEAALSKEVSTCVDITSVIGIKKGDTEGTLPMADEVVSINDITFIYSLSTKPYIVYIPSDIDYDALSGSSSSKGFNIDKYTNPGVLSLSGSVKKITSVGKTLIILTTNGLEYYILKNNKYVYIGNKIPEPKFSFQLDSPKFYEGSCTVEGLIYWVAEKNYAMVNAGSEEDFEKAVEGLYAKLENSCLKDKHFCRPFFVRGAVELQDGSYTYITNPVMLYPTARTNMLFQVTRWQAGTWADTIKDITGRLIGCKLLYKQETDYTDFADLVKDVTIFVSTPIEILKYSPSNITKDGYTHDGFKSYLGTCIDSGMDMGHYEDLNKSINYTKTLDSYGKVDYCLYYYFTAYTPNACQRTLNVDQAKTCFDFMQRLSDKDIINSMIENHIYFKLCDVKSNSSFTSIDDYVQDGVCENITTQTQLEKDDYFNWTNISADGIYSLNRRLIAYNIGRSFFSGFSLHNGIEAEVSGSSPKYIYVRIQTDSGVKIVKTETNDNEIYTSGYWFYYPDPRANHFWIVDSDNYILYEADLKESSQLNGAYHVSAYPSSEIFTVTTKENDLFKLKESGTVELIDNYLMQSEVDNPYTFNSSSYVRVGQGDIIGIAGLTTALSEDAYKVSTTLCFTTQGIWAILSDDEGVFKQVPPPFSREVCNNAESITMVDNAVFFTSARGLMCITDASEGGVSCVSDQLSGNGKSTFLAFLKDCRIAYDYRSSKIVLFKEGEADTWIFDIASKTFSQKTSYLGTKAVTSTIKNEDGTYSTEDKPITALTVVGNYPDNIIQDSDYNLYTLYNKDQRDADTAKYSAELETRPMKLGELYTLKSLRQLEAYCTLSEGATCQIILWASNDLKKWFQLDSIKGSPFRYFKLQYIFNNVRAKDTYTGTLMTYQSRRDYKMS